MARRLLTDPRPQLRDAFAELFGWPIPMEPAENLLREGAKSDDYDAKAVILPLVELIVGEDKPGEVNTPRRWWRRR